MLEALNGHLRSSKCLVKTLPQASHGSELVVLKPSGARHVVVLQPDADCPGSRADCLGLNWHCVSVCLKGDLQYTSSAQTS